MAYKIKKTILYILLVVLAGICLLPFALMVVNSTRSGNDIMTSFSLLPGSSLASNWKIVTDNLNIARGFGNSLFVAICSTLLTAYFSALTALPFSSSRATRLFLLRS